jgi:hypothetical protein
MCTAAVSKPGCVCVGRAACACGIRCAAGTQDRQGGHGPATGGSPVIGHPAPLHRGVRTSNHDRVATEEMHGSDRVSCPERITTRALVGSAIFSRERNGALLPSACRRVLEKYLTPPTLSERRFRDSYPRIPHDRLSFRVAGFGPQIPRSGHLTLALGGERKIRRSKLPSDQTKSCNQHVIDIPTKGSTLLCGEPKPNISSCS